MIGVTLGDPSGIGPEITAKSLPELIKRNIKLTLFGNRDNFVEILNLLNINNDILDKLDFINIQSDEKIEYGKINKNSGSIAIKSIEKAVEYALNNKIDAIATAPINKEAIIMAGSKYIDHTSMLKELTKSKFTTTIFEVNDLRITFLSKHLSLYNAIKYVTKENVFNAIVLADKSLKLLGIKNGRIAVAALNPHGGENGLFGSEEINEIKPAIDSLKNKINVYGPIPADSVFHYASQGKYDIVLSLYHDQGHIAAKTYDFNNTVSMNIGLPFLRTSVDHGTAFDIAGSGIAENKSMLEAILKADKYGNQYRRNYINL